MHHDVMVLGAGIVGLATALKVQETGRSVVLVDRGTPGAETSFGNAGIIERASIYPYGFPQRWTDILRHALNGSAESHYHPRFLPKVLPFLARYWWHSHPERHAVATRGALPLIEASLAEHEPLIAAAGAEHLLRRNGWIKLFRSSRPFDEAVQEARTLRDFGLAFDVLDAEGLRHREPHLTGPVAGAIHLHDPVCVNDPGALSLAYLALFQARGGTLLAADALALDEDPAGWRLPGGTTARDVVVSLGPWSTDLAGRLGYRLPLAVKRGYAQHYRATGNAVLNHTILDAEGGYVLAPMAKGIRLTTGAEFADRDAPPTPVQIARTEPVARQLFPLAEPVDATPHMGSRPCTPDMLPVIGPAPRHKGLWFAFGHAHHGLTMAACTGRLIAEMITGRKTFTSPEPYSATRFR